MTDIIYIAQVQWNDGGTWVSFSAADTTFFGAQIRANREVRKIQSGRKESGLAHRECDCIYIIKYDITLGSAVSMERVEFNDRPLPFQG